MSYCEMKNLVSTSDLKKVNELLKDDWKLVLVYKEPVYVLGKRDKSMNDFKLQVGPEREPYVVG